MVVKPRFLLVNAATKKCFRLLHLTGSGMKAQLRNLSIRNGNYSRPEAIIVGAQKAGTTALFNILAEHTNRVSSIRKELHYFDNNEVYKPDNHRAYHNGFPLKSATKGKLVFEATPSYLYRLDCAERIASYRPDMRIIILLREPAARALSAWNMYHNFKNSKRHKALYDARPFEEAVEEELKVIDQTGWHNNPIAYVKRGIYIPQIKAYTERFPKDQVLIMEAKELREKFESATTRICTFLGADPFPLSSQEANVGKPYAPAEHTEALNMLRTFYQPYNEQLFEFLGVRFNW